MTDSTDTPFTPPTPQALAAKNRSAPGKVTGRLRTALLEMVEKGSRRAEAAKVAGMTDHSVREAMPKAHVMAFYHAALGILRESERPRTFHRLTALRDQDENKNAAVAAAKALEQITDEQQTNNKQTVSPGVTIRIVNVSTTSAPPASPPIVDLRSQRELDEPEPAVPFAPIFRAP
jgi:hypothetical protein